MVKTKDFELPKFIALIRKDGGSSVITIDSKIKKFFGFKEGNYVEVYLKKIKKVT